MKILFLCGSVEVGRDGVGDYSRMLGLELVQQGHEVKILAISDCVTEIVREQTFTLTNQKMEVLRVPGILSWTVRTEEIIRLLNEFNPDWISLQYVPYSFQVKGIPYEFINHLKRIPKKWNWHIMFHETWLGLSSLSPLKHKVVGYFQRKAAQWMVRSLKPQRISTSNRLYQIVLEKAGISASILPLFSNIPVEGTSSMNAPSKDAPSINAPLLDGSSASSLMNAPSKNAPSKNASSMNSPSKDAPSMNAPSTDELPRNELPRNASSINAPSKNASSNDAASKNAPSMNSPSMNEPPTTTQADILQKLGLTGKRKDDFVILGIFGSLHLEYDFERVIKEELEKAQAQNKQLLFVSFGRMGNPQEFNRLEALFSSDLKFALLGELPEAAVSYTMQLLDVAISGTPFEHIGKSGVYAAMRLHNVKVLLPFSDKIPELEAEIREYNNYLHSRTADKWAVDYVASKFVKFLNNI